MRTSWLLPLALVLPLATTSCGGSADAAGMISAAETDLNSGKYDDAVSGFEDALAALTTEDPEYVQAKMGHIKALIYGEPDRAQDEFLKLAEDLPEHVDIQKYKIVGTKMTEAKRFPQAIAVLHAGNEAFGNPESLIAAMKNVEIAAADAGDDGALSQLKGLGYVGD